MYEDKESHPLKLIRKLACQMLVETQQPSRTSMLEASIRCIIYRRRDNLPLPPAFALVKICLTVMRKTSNKGSQQV